MVTYSVASRSEKKEKGFWMSLWEDGTFKRKHDHLINIAYDLFEDYVKRIKHDVLMC
jgi:hypothetical protein